MADFFADRLLTDEAAIRAVCEYEPVTARNIRDYIKGLLRKLGGKETTLERALTLYNKALKDVAAKAQADAENKLKLKGTETQKQESGVQYSAENEESNGQTFEYMKPFAEQIKDFKDKKNRKAVFGKDALLIGPTPKLLQDIGLVRLPVTINQTHVGYAIDDSYTGPEKHKAGHVFEAEEFAKLPEKLADPVAIIADLGKNDLIVYVDMVNSSGEQTIVPFRLLTKSTLGGKQINAQIAKSVYGNEDARNLLISSIEKDSDELVRIYYANEKKIPPEIVSAVRKHGGHIPDGIIHTINDPGSVVKSAISNQTQTEQFRRWFRGSKIVDENGNPLIVYHGTDQNFTVFDPAKGRSTMDIQGMFFSPWEIDASGYGPNVGQYYLSIKNPASEGMAYKALNKFKGQNDAGKKARDYLISLGFDGVNNSDEEYIAFYPTQIKSVTDNVGIFDQSNPDIRYSAEDSDDEYRQTPGTEALEKLGVKLAGSKGRYELDRFLPVEYNAAVSKQGSRASAAKARM